MDEKTAEKIEKLHEKDLTQAEIAEKVGVSPSTVGRTLRDSQDDEPRVHLLSEPVGNATNRISREDQHPLDGGWVDVVNGEHKGRFASYVNTVSRKSDGTPDRILVRSRDADNLLLEVLYGDVRPSQRAGGR